MIQETTSTGYGTEIKVTIEVTGKDKKQGKPMSDELTNVIKHAGSAAVFNIREQMRKEYAHNRELEAVF